MLCLPTNASCAWGVLFLSGWTFNAKVLKAVVSSSSGKVSFRPKAEK